MKPTLQLKLSQHLTLTPQLQQSIRLLQLSTLELNQELEKFLADNPLLEREDSEADAPPVPMEMNGEAPAPAPAEAPAEESGAEALSDTFSADIDWAGDSAPGGAARDDGDENDFPQVAADSPSLREHLLDQLTLTKLEARDRALVALMIEALDEDGYLTQPLDEMAQLLPTELEIEPEELHIALRHLQNLDPTGVGARDCAECLGLQLAALAETAPSRTLALAIVREHLALLATRDFARLKKTLQCDDDELRQAQHLIQSLNPRPGAAFSQPETRYVVPDE